MSENRVAQHRVRHTAEHRGLHGDHLFARFKSYRGKAENLVAVLRDQHLHEAARLGDRSGPEHFGHRHFRQAIFDPARRASDSFRPTRASSGSVNMQNGIRRFLVVRLPPFRLS